jgi:hypothetical protein
MASSAARGAMRKISTNTYLDTEETLERSELWRGFVVRDAASPVFAHQIATTRECWLVTPDEWTIDVIELTPEKRHRRTYDVDTPIVSSVLGPLAFSTDDVFGEVGTGNTIEFPVE